MSSPHDDQDPSLEALNRIARRLRGIGELAILVVSFGFGSLLYNSLTFAGIDPPVSFWIGFAGFIVFGIVFRLRL